MDSLAKRIICWVQYECCSICVDAQPYLSLRFSPAFCSGCPLVRPAEKVLTLTEENNSNYKLIHQGCHWTPKMASATTDTSKVFEDENLQTYTYDRATKMKWKPTCATLLPVFDAMSLSTGSSNGLGSPSSLLYNRTNSCVVMSLLSGHMQTNLRWIHL